MRNPVVFVASALVAGTAFGLPQPSNNPNSEKVEEWGSEPFYPSPWMDPGVDGWESAYQKAADFVDQLNLLEKINLTTGVGWSNGPCVGNTGAIPRLGFKGICNQDSPQGVRFADYVSAFPSSQMAGATFDRNLLYRRAEAMAAEHKGKGITMQLGPVAGPLGRIPEGGRMWEGFGADPVLSGIAMAETVRGIQDTGIIAVAKHYIANEQERFRQVSESEDNGYNITKSLSSNLDDRTLHELYLWPFSDAVRAGVGSVLCSYNQINNSYGCQNSHLINKVLKGELSFQGFVVSDWAGHRSGVSSALAGLDMSMPGDTVSGSGLSYWGSNLTIAVMNGTVPEWRLDDMAMRIMAAYFKVGLTVEDQPDPNFSSWTLDTYGYEYFGGQQGYSKVNDHVNVQGNHSKIIREIGTKGTVLLKNTGSLPLQKPPFVAVLGQDAGPNPEGPNGCTDRACDNGTLAMGWGSGTSSFPYLITPDSAIQREVISYGGRYESTFDNWNLDSAASLASQPEATCIVFGNSDSGEGYLSVDGNWGDRNNLTLWQNADNVIKNVSSICKNTIVVLHSGGPVLMDWIDHPNITAVVWAGLPGQESGNSLVDILWGKSNPAGRSPFTWAKKREDYGSDILYEPNNGDDAPQQTFNEGVYIDYRHFDQSNIEPLYEFGHGLSYTSFEYSNIHVEKKDVSEYQPTTGQTSKAPTFGNGTIQTAEDYVFPETWKYVETFIYPYLNTSSSLKEASGDPEYGRTDFIPDNAFNSTAQSLHPAGDAHVSGGNSMLYDVLYEITAEVKNTGTVIGDEVVQLYVDLGGDNPPRQLRDFDRITIQSGETATFKAQLTRRDLSNWDVVSQNWVVSDEPKTVHVGSSSRKLPLSAKLG